MRAEHGHGAGGHLVEFVHEHGALALAQILDDMSVVHDLVADVDRRAVLGERPLDDLDRTVDAGAEAAWLGQDHPNHADSPEHPPNISHARPGFDVLWPETVLHCRPRCNIQHDAGRGMARWA